MQGRERARDKDRKVDGEIKRGDNPNLIPLPTAPNHRKSSETEEVEKIPMLSVNECILLHQISPGE